jgi:hypothetical protein
MGRRDGNKEERMGTDKNQVLTSQRTTAEDELGNEAEKELAGGLYLRMNRGKNPILAMTGTNNHRLRTSGA